MNKKCDVFNIREIYDILIQLNKTFKIMKENKIVHRDLKPDNILIKYINDKYIVKLCDYGISKIGNFTKLKTRTGTTFYMSPEIMELKEDNIYTYKCDLWSLGIIIYELSFKERPYKGMTEHSIIENINRFGKKKFKKTGDNNLNDLIYKLIENDPEKRLSWDEYFNHPFFKSFYNNEMNIIYEKLKNEEKIKIFGREFVDSNKKNCKIIYKEKEYELTEFFEIEEMDDILEIKLIANNDITDMSHMFSIVNP